jgi:phosphatidylserine/phosphatidylglycerophosphate/cardiolipin synthase-like enzyme
MSLSEDRHGANSLEASQGSAGVAPLPGPGETSPRNPRKRRLRRCLLAVFGLYVGIACYQSSLKPLPTNLSLEGETYQIPAADVEFLSDVTGTKEGQRVAQQMIFDRVVKTIQEAQDFVLVDLFLFNEYLGKEGTIHRRLCQEVTGALLERKRSRPAIQIVVITDPINEAYGGPVPEHFKGLRAAGIRVVPTDLDKLRDSNPLYSSLWRMAVQWFGNSPRGFLPHPFAKGAGGVSVRSWLGLFNFKANHRKLVVADAPSPAGGRQMVCLVMSANPHDASSAHGNVALLVRGGPWNDLLKGEQAILSFSGEPTDVSSLLPAYAQPGRITNAAPQTGQTAAVRVLTEAKIRKGLLEALAGVGSGDTIDIGMFYLSERNVIKALENAAHRGAAIRILLDPNRDAFGYQKNGIPNRPVAAELVNSGAGKITVRWSKTHGEQFHTKMVLIRQRDKGTLFAGSANLTRRNLGDFNLETDLVVSGSSELPALQAAEKYFERLWGNKDLECSVPYETHADTSTLKYWLYRFQELSGTSTF